MTPERFWGCVKEEGDCWVWTGAQNGYGYGVLPTGSRKAMAHRVAYEQMVGVIPEGLVIDHLCRNRLCVNPSHLDPVTNRVNLMRGVGVTARASRATHCPEGHPYDEGDTYRWRGQRHCKQCSRDRCNERQRRRVQCPECGLDVAKGALNRHIRRKHAA